MDKPLEKSGIRIRQVLDYIYSSFGDFTLGFVKVDGKTKRIIICRLGVPPSAKKLAKMQGQQYDGPPAQRTWNQNINKSHNLLLTEVGKTHPFELKICLLTSFNGLKIIWHVPKTK